jgi:hypothetical protein
LVTDLVTSLPPTIRLVTGGWRDVIDAWEPFLARLADDGFEAQLTSVAFPVQLEGQLPSGERFYFRERGGRCSLGVGGDDPVVSPQRSAAEDLWDDSVASTRFLEPPDAYETFTRLLARL